MKTITLTQPWAMLVAIGAKKIETRSWCASYHGPIAIHAAKGFPRWAIELCNEEPFLSALRQMPGITCLDDLPRGAVIATARLAGYVCIPKSQREHLIGGIAEPVLVPPNEPELSFGDYTYGRWAWILDDVKPLPEPIPARGALGLWNWERP